MKSADSISDSKFIDPEDKIHCEIFVAHPVFITEKTEVLPDICCLFQTTKKIDVKKVLILCKLVFLERQINKANLLISTEL